MSLDVDELPSFSPLSHETPILNSSGPFDVDAFLISRSTHTSLPELRSELREYLSSLKAELVQLINDDYESFISLSTDLRGEGTRLERMQWPLKNIAADILTSKLELQAIQDAVQTKLSERAALREEKALLHLLLKISESVARMENLLFITSSDTDTYNPGEISRSPPIQFEERVQTSKAKDLSRIASEYAQLQYLVEKARTEKCEFIDVLAPRITRIKNTLTSDISTFFATTLLLKPASERERSKKLADVNECLQIYDSLGLHLEAEEVMRREIMRPFVKKTVFPNALTTPSSPIVPHTPLPMAQIIGPQTPFTPLPAPSFISQSSYSQDDPPLVLVDDSGPLGAFYNTLLRFVDREFRSILSISHRINVMRPDTDAERKRGYQILVNIIWDELGTAIMDELGVVIFVVGKPDEFQKNYRTSISFLRALEALAPSSHAVEAMRTHTVYQTFEKRWQLSVYFQLRWKEIVVGLEEALATSPTRLTEQDKQNSANAKGFASVQAISTYRAIQKCWSEDVYIPDLGWRFWRLTLQILTRYFSWLEGNLPRSENGDKNLTLGNTTFPRASTPAQRSSTPDTNIHDSTQEDISLKQAATIITDVLGLRSKVNWIWQAQIQVLLPDAAETDIPLEGILVGALEGRKSVIDLLASIAISILSRRCCDALTPLRQLPSQFRAMSSKRTPTRPSEYVLAVMKPVRTFFGIGVAGEAIGSMLAERYAVEWASEVFEAVVIRYSSVLSTMRKNEESLRRLKRGQRTGFSLFGASASSTASSDDNVAEDRVRSQVVLDVDALGNDAESLGVLVRESESYRALKELATSRYEDGT